MLIVPLRHVNSEPLGRAADQLDSQVDLQPHLLLGRVVIVGHVVREYFGSGDVCIVYLVEVVDPEVASHVMSGDIHCLVL